MERAAFFPSLVLSDGERGFSSLIFPRRYWPGWEGFGQIMNLVGGLGGFISTLWLGIGEENKMTRA